MLQFQVSIVILLLCIKLSAWAFTEKTIHFCHTPPSASVRIPGTLMKDQLPQDFKTFVQDVKCPTNSRVDYNMLAITNSALLFLSNGDIEVDGTEKDYLFRNEYCVTSISGDSVSIKSCSVECGVTHTCIYKCCPPGQFVDFSKDPHKNPPCSFSNKTEDWTPIFYKTHQGCGVKTEDVTYHVRPQPQNYTGFEFQPYKHLRVNYSDKVVEGLRFRLMHDGSLKSQSTIGTWETLNASEFCIDGLMNYIGNDKRPYHPIQDQVFLQIFPADEEYFNTHNSTQYDSFEPNENETQLAYLDEEGNTDLFEHEEHGGGILWLEIFYITLMLFGSFFLFLTATLYLLIWEKHNIHGWTIFAYISTMMLMFIFLAISKIFSISMYSDFGGTSTCRVIGILAHFLYQSTICWLTVINVDLWLTFRNVKPGGSRSQWVKNFIFYTLFAFGISFLIVGFAVLVDYIHEGSFGDGSECEPALVLPLYGLNQCYIQKGALLYYFIIPLAILITFNVAAFSSTVFTLCRYRNQTKNAVSHNSNHESLILFGKLFIVTGISWGLELVTFALPPDLWLTIVLDMYNLLQALLIFYIFALKRENLIALYQKYPRMSFLLVPIMRQKCCYAQSFDTEQTDVTAVPFDQRHSRIHFRRGSNVSVSENNASSVSFK